MKNGELFIQRIIKHEKSVNHEGMTHDLLNIPRNYNLSHTKPLLKKIIKTPIGNVIDNPLKIGKKRYHITKELKQHVNSALNLINISQSYHKRKKDQKK